jgi:RTX calcium-binding nonapeptide repeat (4 copies)
MINIDAERAPLLAEARTQAARFGFQPDSDRENAFIHVYTSARLVQTRGAFVAWAGGTGQELWAHWRNRENTNPDDPNERADSYRDLWNNAVGREVGRIAVYNAWTRDQIADHARNTVLEPVGDHTAAIVSRTDSRVPANLSRLSTFDYLFGLQGPNDVAIHSVAPPGTLLPNPSVGGDFAGLTGSETFTDDQGPLFTLQRNGDGTVSFVAILDNSPSDVTQFRQEYSSNSQLMRIDVSFADGSGGYAVVNAADRSAEITSFVAGGGITEIDQISPASAVVAETFDILDAFLWDHQVREFAANGSPIGEARDYTSAFDGWLLDHEFTATEIAQFDAQATVDFSAAFERAAFRGLEFQGSTPSPLSFEAFGSAYDFSGPTFSVSPSGNITAQDAGLGFDVSGYFSGGANGIEQFGIRVNILDVLFSVLNFLFSPIVLDLDNSGISITPRADSTVYMDVDLDGYLEQTAWAGPQDGVLAFDINNDGINRPDEFSFARSTADPDDTDLEALRSLYDSSNGGNNNGLLDPGDALWGRFRVWRDANNNGTIQSNEVFTLGQLGITSIVLTTDGNATLLPDGTRINGIGNYTINGSTRSFADVALSYNPDGFDRETENILDQQGFIIGREIIYRSENGPTRRIWDATNSNPVNIFNLEALGDYQGYIGSGGSDQLHAGGAEHVTISAGNGNDVVAGGEGNDVLDGGQGSDQIYGGAGDDTIYFEVTDAVYSGESGHDTGILIADVRRFQRRRLRRHPVAFDQRGYGHMGHRGLGVRYQHQSRDRLDLL